MNFIRLPEDFDDPAFSTVTIQRDLFYGYDTLMENVSDPSHIDFAHHKVCFECCYCQYFNSISLSSCALLIFCLGFRKIH